jgi:hypothetical protein
MNYFLDKGKVGIMYGDEMIYRQYIQVFRNAFVRKNQTQDKRQVLFFFAMGAESTYNARNLMLAKFFELKDWNAEFLICDGAFSLCHKERIGKTRKNSSLLCFECKYGYNQVARQTGMSFLRLGNFSTGLESKIQKILHLVNNELKTIKDCTEFRYDDYDVGEIVKVSVLRYHYTGHLRENYLEIYKKYILEAVRCMHLFKVFLKDRKKDLVILWNGAGFMDRMVIEVCKRKGIDYVTQESFWGDSSWIYKKNGIAIHLDFEREYDLYGRLMPFETKEKARVNELVKSFRGIHDANKVFSVSKELGLKENERFAVLFTNMNFDTYVLGRDRVFSSMTDWVVKTIEFWKMRKPQMKLVIRAHPGELKFVTPSSDFVRDIVNPLKFDNLIFIDADNSMDSYGLVKNAEAVLVYSSTIGVESILMGKYVVSSGTSFYDRFVEKPSDIADYYRLLDNIMSNNFSTDYDLEEMMRYLNFIYFHRIVNLKGMGINRRMGENYIDTTINAEELIKLNQSQLNSFYFEVIDEAV